MANANQSTAAPENLPPVYPRSENRLSGGDYCVVGALLLLYAAIGVFYGLMKESYTRSQAAYFLGGRQLGIAPVALSLIVSFFSAINIVRYL